MLSSDIGFLQIQLYPQRAGLKSKLLFNLFLLSVLCRATGELNAIRQITEETQMYDAREKASLDIQSNLIDARQEGIDGQLPEKALLLFFLGYQVFHDAFWNYFAQMLGLFGFVGVCAVGGFIRQ